MFRNKTFSFERLVPLLQGQQNWEQTCSDYMGIFNTWDMQFKGENTNLDSSQGQWARKQCFMGRWVFLQSKVLPPIWLQMHRQDVANAWIKKANGSINTAFHCLTNFKFQKSFSWYNFVCCIPFTEYFTLSVLNLILDLLGLNWEREILFWLRTSPLKSIRHLDVSSYHHTFIHLYRPIIYIHTTIYNSVSYIPSVMKWSKTKYGQLWCNEWLNAYFNL